MAQLKSTNITGNLAVTGNTLASKIIKLGGTNDDILMGDGSTTSKQALIDSLEASMAGDTNTTYSFTGGNNGFTVTPSDGSAQSVGVQSTRIFRQDTRSDNPAPYESGYANSGYLSLHLKTNSTIGITDQGDYSALVEVYPWGDSSGGSAHQLAFGTNGAILHRYGTSTWSAWNQLATQAWVEGKGYTGAPDLSNYVTLNGAQTISGIKTFSTYIKTAENTMGIKLRTHDNYETGWAYGTSGNEAITLAIQNPVTAFQIVYGTKPSAYGTATWQSVTPLFQTKDGKVIINRKISKTEDTTGLKLLDVNGDIGANDIFVSDISAADITCNKVTFPQESGPSIYSSTNIDGVYIDYGVDTPKVRTSVISAPTTSGGSTYGVGSNGQVLKSNGTTVYWGTDSSNDTKVTQTVTTSSNTSKRPLLLGYSYSDAATPSFSTVTNTAYASHNIYVAPKDGYLYATKLYSGGKEVLTSHQSLSGYVTGSGLTADYIILGNDNSSIKKGSCRITTNIDDNATNAYIPTAEAVDTFVSAKLSGVGGSDKKTSSSSRANTELKLIGAIDVSSNGVETFTNPNCYIGTDNCLYSNGKKVATEEWVEVAIKDKISSVKIYSEVRYDAEGNVNNAYWTPGWREDTGSWDPSTIKNNSSATYTTTSTITSSNQTVTLRRPYSSQSSHSRWVMVVTASGMHGLSISGATVTTIENNKYKIQFAAITNQTITLSKGEATFVINIQFQTASYQD